MGFLTIVNNIKNAISDFFTNVKIVNDIDINKDFTKIKLGIKISKNINLGIYIKSTNQVTKANLIWGKRKVSLYLNEGKIYNAVLLILSYIKAIIFNNKSVIKKFKKIMISKKKYKRLKNLKIDRIVSIKPKEKKKDKNVTVITPVFEYGVNF